MVLSYFEMSIWKLLILILEFIASRLTVERMYTSRSEFSTLAMIGGISRGSFHSTLGWIAGVGEGGRYGVGAFGTFLESTGCCQC